MSDASGARWVLIGACFFRQLSFDVGIVTIFGGRLDEGWKEELRRNYGVVEKGYNSFPNSFPGTLYHKAIQVSDRRKTCALPSSSRSYVVCRAS